MAGMPTSSEATYACMVVQLDIKHDACLSLRFFPFEVLCVQDTKVKLGNNLI